MQLYTLIDALRALFISVVFRPKAIFGVSRQVPGGIGLEANPLWHSLRGTPIVHLLQFYCVSSAQTLHSLGIHFVFPFPLLGITFVLVVFGNMPFAW